MLGAGLPKYRCGVTDVTAQGPARIESGVVGRMLRGEFSLVALLGGAALSEFLLYRLLTPLLHLFPSGLPLRVRTTLEALGTFAAHFASVLALLVGAGLLRRLLRRGGLGATPIGRMGFGVMMAVFLLMAFGQVFFPAVLARAIGLVRSQWLAQTSSVCVALLTLLSVLPRRRIVGAHKLALALLLLPPLLLLENQWHLIAARSMLLRFSLMLVIYGSTVAALALGLAGLLLAPLRSWRWREDSLALAATSIVSGAMSALLLFDHGAAARIIYIGFDLHLPAEALVQGLFMLSLSAWTFSVMSLLLRPGSSRRIGIGLALLGLAGSQPRAIHQVAFYLCGLLCLADVLLANSLRSEAPTEKEA